MALSLRHGPVPAGQCMYDVTTTETITLAQAEGLVCVQQLEIDGHEGCAVLAIWLAEIKRVSGSD